MAAVDEHEMMRSIDEVDAERTRTRKAVAKQVHDLGVQYDELVEQVNDVVQQLRTAVASARKHFDGLEELALHTKRSLPDLTAWAEGNDAKATRRTKRSNPVGAGRTPRRVGPTGSGSVAVPSPNPSTSQGHPSAGPVPAAR
jgi:hypothetical protein